MSEVKKTYASLEDPKWKIKKEHNIPLPTPMRKSLSNIKKIFYDPSESQDDRINNYYNQRMEITLDDGTKEIIQVLKKPIDTTEGMLVFSDENNVNVKNIVKVEKQILVDEEINKSKKTRHPYKIIPTNATIKYAINTYIEKMQEVSPIDKAIHEWLDILISNNNDCTYILYESQRKYPVTYYRVIAIGSKVITDPVDLIVNENGCIVEDDYGYMTCKTNVSDCGSNKSSKGGAKSRKPKSRKLGRKLARKLARKLGTRKYNKK